MSANTEYKFEGWMGNDPSAAKGKMVWSEYEPKPFEETDVDIKITHCGVCGSDIHTLRSGWAPTNYPCVVGHEIIGHAVRVGSKVKGIKVGDRVGVGAQSGACMNQHGDCEACADGQVFSKIFMILPMLTYSGWSHIVRTAPTRTTVNGPMAANRTEAMQNIGVAKVTLSFTYLRVFHQIKQLQCFAAALRHSRR